MFSPYFKLSRSFVLLCLAGYIAPLSAASGDEVQQDGATDIEVINIYAQRRSQNSQDVAVAVTSLDGEQLSKRHIKDVIQLSNSAPNFHASYAAGEGTAPALTLRGVGMFDYNTSTLSPIAIYHDDVVSGSANFLSSSLYDLAHVEILRGPQGTLFGRNTTGGAILLMSALPESEAGGYVSISAAEQNLYRLQSAVNLPVSEKTAMRLALHHQDYDFSMNNLFPGGDSGGMRQSAGRLLLQTQQGNWSVLAKLEAEQWRGTAKPVYSAGIFQPESSAEPCPIAQVGTRHCIDAFGGFTNSDDYWTTVANNQHKTHATDAWGSSVAVEYKLSDISTIKSVTAIKQLERQHQFDADGPGQFIEGDLGSNNDFFSQELSLNMTKGAWYWSSGLFYLEEELQQRNSLDLFRQFRSVAELAHIPAQFFYHNDIKNQAQAIYSQLDNTINERFSLTAGIRYTQEQTRYQAVADLDTVAFTLPQLWHVQDELNDDNLSTKLALIQKLSATNSLYYSFSQGYKSGGYNGGFANSAEQAANSDYGAETLNAYEIGAKLYWPVHSARLNMSAFYYDYQDQQVFVNFTSGPAPYHVLKNAGDGRIAGIEAEFSINPTQALSLDISLGHIPLAKLGEYREGELFVADSRLPFTPRWTLAGNMFYQQQLFAKSVQWQLGFNYQSEMYFDQYESAYTRQPGYSLWHGSVSVTLAQAWELSLWGKNLFNQRYAELKFDSIAALGAITELRGEQRQLGVQLKYSF